VFEDSGFVVVRDGALWLAFRCGVAAPAFLPAHAHADALSFQLWWDGHPVVVDAGSSTYDAGRERAWERSTAAHSTVRVDARDQFRPWGAFRSGPLPPVELIAAGEGFAEALVRLPGGVVHRRRLEWDAPGATLSILDTIGGHGRHGVESRLLWAPGLRDAAVEAEGLGRRDEPASTSERFGARDATTASVFFTDSELPTTMTLRLPRLE
jgi:hypothetical protein